MKRIPEPFWGLMLSTNDCYPGCGCDLDVFDITLERVRDWLCTEDGISVEEVLLQAASLKAEVEKNGWNADFANQTNLAFRDQSSAERWADLWLRTLNEAIESDTDRDPRLPTAVIE